ncbi:exopolyphosphatase PRUNE1 [Spea bombifrons]|uniref:exopolyphosphatase PRUNE1 n=1 Tax=Spea bombifrons TaxID=233779 RepID=UPI00234AC433|nr:exopolyphosphatase PRUNE1 [Spea bombifrons]
MEHFLQGCKAALQEKHESLDFHIVLGNEACDLDSMVSAMTLAYFLAKTSSSKNLVHIPVLNIPREDFPLRTESTFFLKENGISQEILTFRDEIDIPSLYESGQLMLTLVDHNVLPSADSFMEDVVTEVIDHRALERRASMNCEVTSELVGSCTTLIAEKIIRAAPNILDRQLASLLRGTIVLDCVNMTPAAGKVTPKDSELVTTLESMFPSLPLRTEVFDSLQIAKFDVSGLTTEQMLRKDMKAITSRDLLLAISSIYISLEDFVHRANLESDLRAFCQRHGYNVLIAMAITFNSDNEPTRQIAVYSQREELRASVCTALEEAANPSLKLSLIPSDPCKTIVSYHQGNAIASRKKVLPILKDFLRKRDFGNRASQLMQSIQDTEKPKARFGFGEQATDEGLDDNDFTGEPGDRSNTPDVDVGEDFRGKGSNSGFKKQSDDGAEEENSFPPTPMNSLVEGCPLDRGLPKFTAEAILERFSRITAVDSEVKSSGGSK